ncbi:MAG: hypothetical protein ACOC1P_02690 [Minisyncoccales bacterium]
MDLVDKLSKTRDYLIWARKRAKNRPENFKFVSKDEQGEYVLPEGFSSVEEVGDLRDVFFVPLHDGKIWAVRGEMTNIKYLERKDVNAVYVDNTIPRRDENGNPFVYIQPLKLY